MEDDFAGKKCVKCPEPAKFAGIDVKKAVYCRSCFIQMVKGRFRTTLSKKRIFKDREPREALVLFEGKASSVFLLRQIEDAVKQINFKRLMISPKMLVLTTTSDPSNIAVLEEKVQSLRSILPSVDFFIVHVAVVFLEEPIILDENSGKCHGFDKISELRILLKSCTTTTSEAEVFRILREKACSLVAKSLGIKKILMPDCADDLGSVALAQLCLGRGGAISDFTGVVDKRPTGITFVRPLRDVSLKEISIVNHLEEYMDDYISFEDSLIKPSLDSIQGTTDEFINILVDEGFKGTVSAVLGTASKLHWISNEVTCSMCERAPVQDDNLCTPCLDLMKEVRTPENLLNVL